MKFFVKPTPNESVFGLIYYILQILIVPGILVVAHMMTGKPLSETIINVQFFAVNFVAVWIIFRKFLVANFRFLLKEPLHVLLFAAIGILIYMGGNAVFSALITLIDPGFANVNDAAILDMVQESFGLMTLGTVVLVPIAEECFYRGLIFRNIYDRSPVWAYIASMVLFSLAHVAGYLVLEDFKTLVLCFFQYLPAGFALAFAYRHSGSIFASVLIHMGVNLVGMLLMR